MAIDYSSSGLFTELRGVDPAMLEHLPHGFGGAGGPLPR
jgi:hypothetical protein